MSKLRYNIIQFPGSNCDYDSYHIAEIRGNEAEFVWHKDTVLKNPDIVILPGGFSYGDYLRAGAIAKFSPIIKEVIKFANNGGLVLGICNGFQILTECGLLPGSLTMNNHLDFICKHQEIKVINNATPFTEELKEGQILKIPIAHKEGNYAIDEDGLKKLRENNQILFRYCGTDGKIDEDNNPNGSVYNIAGICNEKGNVLGMMPHPERAAEKGVLPNTDGTGIFDSMEKYSGRIKR
ncbi:MAG: phosphoribosylformylglycinamidine synthase I [Candidatus Cloacimonadota bacterium]|nr:MAG: phosphoribosylformylglycinamidine synthase I [Candidatus Cloacimonadota bacterium]